MLEKRKIEKKKGKRCPVCGRWSYFCWPGSYDREEWGEGRKINPDFYRCTKCGFSYEEHVLIPEEEAAKAYVRGHELKKEAKKCSLILKTMS